MDFSPPGSVHGVLQARMLEWVTISFSNTVCFCLFLNFLWIEYMHYFMSCINNLFHPCYWYSLVCLLLLLYRISLSIQTLTNVFHCGWTSAYLQFLAFMRDISLNILKEDDIQHWKQDEWLKTQIKIEFIPQYNGKKKTARKLDIGALKWDDKSKYTFME